MRIAIFLENLQDAGGGFQQALSTIESLVRKSATKHEFLIFVPFERTRQRLLKEGIGAIRFRRSGIRLIDRWSATQLGNAILRRLRQLGLRRLGRYLDALLDDHGIDLVMLDERTEIAARIGDHPIIVTVWDLDHRDYPEFPEAYADRLFERRERQLRVMLTRAYAVITNSPSGAHRIASLYQVDPHRIIELPFVPSLAVRRHAAGSGVVTADGVRHKYSLPPRYVFYPSDFFPLKNHLYLLDGLAMLERQRGITLHAVFCGGGTAEHRATVERQVQALRLTARVQFLGYVPDEDISALYEGAFAVVMPAYNGPTNLPPLEAVTLGCPVICSDLPGCREQMGDAALYCDLSDVSSLANHLEVLIRDSTLRDNLKEVGRRFAAEIAKIDYGERLAPVLDGYAYLRRRWTWPESIDDRNGRFGRLS